MDRIFEPRDWVRATDRHEGPSVRMPKRHEKHDSGVDAEPDLERVNLSVSTVISAWGIYSGFRSGHEE